MQQFRAEVCIIILVAGLLFFVPVGVASEATPVPDLKWPRPRIVVAISRSLAESPAIQGDVAYTVQRSTSSWTEAADLRIDTVDSDLLSVSPKGIRGDGVSLITIASTAENVALFPKQAESPAAATRIFSDRRGNITEADIVLNPFVRFSTDGTFGTFDLEATITHEIGHLLGLDHSPAWGSVMFHAAGMSFGPAMHAGSREGLSETDAAAIRGIYGARSDDSACCGVLTGRVWGIPAALKKRSVSVWLEDIASGRLLAAGLVSDGGIYELKGLRKGTYRLRVAAEIGTNISAFAEESVQVSVGDISGRDIKLTPAKVSFSAYLFGTSPQIAALPGKIQPGGSSSIFIGGRGVDKHVAKVGISGVMEPFGSPDFRVSDYGDAVKVISFQIPDGLLTTPGEYSILLEDSTGVRRFLIGALVVVR